MTMARMLRWALLGGVALALGCSRTEAKPAPAPPPAPVAAIEPSQIDEARAKVEAAAQELQAKSADGEAPQQPSAEEEARTRAAVEAVLQDVRKQLEQKAAELGTAQPGAPAQP
jgi:hypothetical protein